MIKNNIKEIIGLFNTPIYIDTISKETLYVTKENYELGYIIKFWKETDKENSTRFINKGYWRDRARTLSVDATKPNISKYYVLHRVDGAAEIYIETINNNFEEVVKLEVYLIDGEIDNTRSETNK